ncbi:MAG: hypothetical protein JXL97_14235 [Bacteroidales bacterium]|nr:hypothetical protein [Bacteroidales bacterium]
MRRFFIILFLIFFYITGNSQKFEIYKGDTINKTDVKNLKQGTWIYFNDTYIGGISQKGEYIDNKKENLWEAYHPNGKVKSQINYKNNKQYGEVSIFYPNGNIQEKGYWKINRWVGEYEYYYENGIEKYHWYFDEQGKRTGKQTYYYDNGQTQIVGEWTQGKEAGTINEYYATGQVKKVSNFDNGTINGSVTEYYTNGQVKTKSVYVNGQVDQSQSFAYAPNNDNTNNNNNNNVNDNNNNQDNNPDYKTFSGTGYYKFVNENGKVEREGNFVNGVLIDGKRYIYDDNGIKIKTAIIENGRTIRIENENE